MMLDYKFDKSMTYFGVPILLSDDWSEERIAKIQQVADEADEELHRYSDRRDWETASKWAAVANACKQRIRELREMRAASICM